MDIIPIEDADVRDGKEFEFTKKPSNMAASTFTAITNDKTYVTRRFTNLKDLPDDTPVIAHWHGHRRTDAFILTISKLKEKAAKF